LLSGGEVVNYGATWELFLKPDAKMREFLGEKIILPNVGVNFALYFQKEVAFDSVITQMARDLNINLNISKHTNQFCHLHKALLLIPF